jgi:hypothetical protein
MCPGVLVRIAGACAGTLNALIYTIIAQFSECKVALLVLLNMDCPMLETCQAPEVMPLI